MVRHQWLMPILLATQEAEIRRITVQSQPLPVSKIPLQIKGLAEWLKQWSTYLASVRP
jgi:hypothetical protein